MSKHKRDLVREYKERKQRAGVFAVRCAATGEVWVAGSPNVDRQQNSIWFGLKLGTFINKAMQAAWTVHGEDAFSYEILDELTNPPTSAYALRADLKTLEDEWRAKLSAGKALG